MIDQSPTPTDKSGTDSEIVNDDAATIAALRQKIEFYEAIINNLPNDLVVFDTNHTYVLINQTAIKDNELRKFMLGKTDFDYCEHRKVPNAIALQRREKFNYVMDNKAIYKWEEAKDVSGKTEVVSRTMRPVLGKDGDVKYVLGYGMDISELRAAERSLQELNRHLQEQVADRTRELTESNISLENFAYSVSHDLRGPLRHVAAYTALLKRSIQANDTEAQTNYLNYIIDSAKKMEQQIDGLLQLSRISSNTLNLESFNIEPQFQAALSVYKNYYSVSDIQATIQADTEVYADKNLMSTVIENLISNAIKYSKPKGSVNIDINYTLADKEIIFSIADQGIGFDMGQYDKLFGIFQRMNQDNEVEGLGIGLSHVKQIIDKHNGKIWAESVPGQGTTFFFTLPR
jgi:signal transduction histidine kinase